MLFGFDVTTLGIIFVAVIIGGIFKGIVGLGLPIVSIAILLNFLLGWLTVNNNSYF